MPSPPASGRYSCPSSPGHSGGVVSSPSRIPESPNHKPTSQAIDNCRLQASGTVGVRARVIAEVRHGRWHPHRSPVAQSREPETSWHISKQEDRTPSEQGHIHRFQSSSMLMSLQETCFTPLMMNLSVPHKVVRDLGFHE